MSMKDYEILQKLGDGAYSVVYKVKRISDQSIYALKKVRILKLKEKEKRNALNEIRFLASIKHKNIIAYKEAFFDESSQSLCLVIEYADGGDLLEKIKHYQKKGSYMSENFVWSVIIQLSKGLRCIHELNIVHRDLKSANVFLTASGGVKLGDLNVSKISKDCLMHTQTGTPYYASPEVWKDEPYDYRSDLWSFGCVIYEMVALKPPFRAEDMQGLYKKVIKGEYPSIPKSFSADLSGVIAGLIQLNPNSRLKSEDIIVLPVVSRHIKVTEELESPSYLLKTIVFPESLGELPEQLPQPNFEESSPHRNKSNLLPKIKSINRKIILREKSEPPTHAAHSSNDRNSDKSLYYLKYYREMILKENYGALKVSRARHHYSKQNEGLRGEHQESPVARNKSEKITRKPNTNKSLLLKIEHRILEDI